MRTETKFNSASSTLMSAFASGMAEAMAVRRAGMMAKAARAEAEMSIKARAEFLANMNHELRTPLNAVIGFATMLKEGEAYKLTDEQRETYAGYILQSADLLLSHINTLLEAAALDGGALSFEPDAVDLSAALDEAVKRAKIAADAAKVSIDIKSDGAAAQGWGDNIRTGQALDHIIRTAIKVSPEGSRILVRALADSEGWAEIAVRDRGPGMSEGEIEKALTAFQETHRGLDRSFAGPGIGLAIAKTFVELQGGRFSVKSKIGEGTLVRIALRPPQAAAAAQDDEMKLAG
jgi:two-component system cell cycle sensor histidine kinase PleC